MTADIAVYVDLDGPDALDPPNLVAVVYDEASLADMPTDDEMDIEVARLTADVESWPARRAARYAAMVEALSYGAGEL